MCWTEEKSGRCGSWKQNPNGPSVFRVIKLDEKRVEIKLKFIHVLCGDFVCGWSSAVKDRRPTRATNELQRNSKGQFSLGTCRNHTLLVQDLPISTPTQFSELSWNRGSSSASDGIVIRRYLVASW